MNKEQKEELQRLANLSTVRNHLNTLVNTGKSLNKKDLLPAGHLVTKLDCLMFNSAVELFKDQASPDVDDGLNIYKRIQDEKTKLKANTTVVDQPLEIVETKIEPKVKRATKAK